MLQPVGSSKYFPPFVNFSYIPQPENHSRLYDLGGMWIGGSEQAAALHQPGLPASRVSTRMQRVRREAVHSAVRVTRVRPNGRTDWEWEEELDFLAVSTVDVRPSSWPDEAGSGTGGRGPAGAQRVGSTPPPGSTPGEQPVDVAWSKYGWWLLSDDAGLNPDMWGWNHVLVPYCSQDLHSGQVLAGARAREEWCENGPKGFVQPG